MKKEIKIFQTGFVLDFERMQRIVVLTEVHENKIHGSYSVEIPEWFNYYDQIYKQYPFVHN